MFNRISTKTVRLFGVRPALLVLSVVLLAVLVGTCLPQVNAEPAVEFVPGIEDDAAQEENTGIFTKDPLGAEFCTAVDTYIESEVEAFALSADGEAVKAMAAFYKATGVQPYLVITDTVRTESMPEWEDDPAYYYLQDKYLRLFGMDEGHYLVLMLLKETGGFDVRSRAGNDAYFVMDDDAIEKTEALINNTCDLNDLDNTLAQAFTQAATEVMQYDQSYAPFEISGGYYTSDGEFVFDPEEFIDSYSEDDDSFYYVFGFLLLPPAIFVGIMVKRAREENVAPAGKRTSAQAPAAYESWANSYLPEVKQTPVTEVAPKKANYPITCPGCGATAYPNDDGTCQYCGRAIFDPRA